MLRIDVRMTPAGSAAEILREARAAEQWGYDGIWARETNADPFPALAIAASGTHRVRLGTSVAVALARNPMNLAYLGSDLSRYSEGRFVLGLGSQVKAHIERRFAMPWSRPAARMEEMIRAIRHIWRCWENGEQLVFHGDFYRHTLMLPEFTPPPAPAPSIMLAAVGGRMLDVATRVADVLAVHAFTTRRHMLGHTLPRVRAGLEAAGRDEFEISMPVLLATGTTPESMATAVAKLRRQIAFYGSTPAYRPVLETHGWDDLARELHTLSRSAAPDRWTRMTDAVSDEVLTTVGVVAEPADAARLVAERVRGLADRISLYPCAPTDPALLAEVSVAVRKMSAEGGGEPALRAPL